MSSEGAEIETTRDDFLGGGLTLLQPAKGHRSGIDAVLLAAACPAVPGDAVGDLGAGAGVAGLCVLRRVARSTAVLIEIDSRLCDLAAANLAANSMAGRGRVACLDIGARGAARAAGFERPGLDHLIANPPFETHGRARLSPYAARARAHAAAPGMLDAWVRFAAATAGTGASLTMIHRADRLGEVLSAFGRRFGGVRVKPVHPRPGEAASRILVQGFRGSRAPLSILPPLVLHGASGHGFAGEAEAVLRGGGPLAMA
ncbi:MAG: tRNA1(Val) (adenine(37)-N6)-methyltransferase [Flavobacteriaceae bacterium]